MQSSFIKENSELESVQNDDPGGIRWINTVKCNEEYRGRN